MSNFSNNENNNNDYNSNDTVYNKITDEIYRGDITPDELRKYLTKDKYKHLINEKDDNGNTFLHTAITSVVKNPEIIIVLLELGADPNIPNKYDYTPFLSFVESWHYNVKHFGKDTMLYIFDLFLENDADAKSFKPKRMKTPRGYRNYPLSRQKTAAQIIKAFYKEEPNNSYKGINMGFKEAREMLTTYRRRKQVVEAAYLMGLRNYTASKKDGRRLSRPHKRHKTRKNKKRHSLKVHTTN
jgi:hypothetical protein